MTPSLKQLSRILALPPERGPEEDERDGVEPSVLECAGDAEANEAGEEQEEQGEDCGAPAAAGLEELAIGTGGAAALGAGEAGGAGHVVPAFGAAFPAAGAVFEEGKEEENRAEGDEDPATDRPEEGGVEGGSRGGLGGWVQRGPP